MPLDPSLAAKYLTAPTQQQRRGRTDVDRADAVPIQEILGEMGFPCPYGISGSWKMSCPWGGEHKDGGIEQHFRVYPGNTCNCFAGHGTMRPTQLLAKWKGWSRTKAAEHILGQRGLDRPKSYQERWVKLSQQAKQRALAQRGAPENLVRAVQVRLSTSVAYQQGQFEEPVLARWRELLSELDAIMVQPSADAGVMRLWVETACTELERLALTVVHHQT